MTTTQARRVVAITLALLALISLWRVLAQTQPWALLQYDEIYYYHWSLEPDWGYYSKPPGIAWLIALGTGVFGHGFWGIKAGAIACWLAAALVIGAIAASRWGIRAGAAAALLFHTAPLAGFYSLFATTDALLLLTWSVALGAYLHARDRDTPLAWALAGAAVGAGLLCKYNMALLGLAFALDALTTAGGRRLIGRPGPWIAVVAALVVFAPNVLWNLSHEFVAWRHTGEISRLGAADPALDPLGLAGFLVTQLGLFGPVSGLALIASAPTIARAARDRADVRTILWAGGCSLLTIAAMALMTRAFANWAAPTLVAVALLAGWLLRDRTRLVAASVIVNLCVLGALMHWPLLLSLAAIERTRTNDPWTRHGDWDRAAVALSECLTMTRADIEGARFASDSRELLAQLQFRLRPGRGDLAFWQPDPDRIANWYDQRDNLRDFIDTPDQQFLLLGAHLGPDEIAAAFRHSRRLCRLEDPRSHGTNEVIEVHLARGFLGYPGANPGSDR